MKTIVLTGGGTAGHVLPHVALLPHLRRDFQKIYYIGSTNAGEKTIIENEGIQFFPLQCVKLRRGLNVKNIAKNMAIPFGYFKSVSTAKRILIDLKPDVVFSKGGFVALPVVRACKSLKIPVVAHESDASMGLANRLSVGACSAVCTTFPYPKFTHTGSPIRQKIYNGKREIITARHAIGTPTSNRRNLLVLGGSLGAQNINNAVLRALNGFLSDFNVIHVCGRGKIVSPNLDAFAGARYVALEFVNDMENYMAWADIVVSRAGSSTLCELMVLQKPTLFIPLASGRGDQLDNVKIALEHNACNVLYERDLTPETLTEKIRETVKNAPQYRKNSRLVITDGTQKIAEIISSKTP